MELRIVAVFSRRLLVRGQLASATAACDQHLDTVRHPGRKTNRLRTNIDF
jgi:hypothetical protein